MALGFWAHASRRQRKLFSLPTFGTASPLLSRRGADFGGRVTAESPTSSESRYAFLQGDLGCLANLETDFGLLRGCRNEFHEQLAWPSAMPFGMEGVVFRPSKATATVKAILQGTVPNIPGP